MSREFIALAAMKALADQQVIDPVAVENALTAWGIYADKPNPMRA